MSDVKSKGFTLWFTGLPCAGKTTIANALAEKLFFAGHPVERLDGDVVRKELSKDLGFSREHREINIERVAFVAAALTRHGITVLVSLVSPYSASRENARRKISAEGSFIEVYVRCRLDVCEARDVKGMYKKARSGQISEFTGVSDPYEAPEHAEITVNTEVSTPEECCKKIMDYLDERQLLLPGNPFPENEILTRAYQLARKQHFGQMREGGLPYITHPIAVAKMLKEFGCPDEVVAAGLLHDVLEDTGCEYEKMDRVVGPAVTKIVAELTEKDKTLPWKQRKENYLKSLKSASREALMVCCADKAHNLFCLVEGYRRDGEKFTRLFSGGMLEKLENYENILKTIEDKFSDCKLLKEYKNNLKLFEKVIKKP